MPIKFLNEINNFTIKGESGVSTLNLDGSEFDAVLIKAGLADLIEYDTQDNLIDIGSYNGSNPIISGSPGSNVSLMYTSSEALRTIPNGIYIPNRIGVGTTSPTSKLEVEGGDILVDNGQIFIDRDTAGAALTWRESDSSTVAGQLRSYANRGDIYLYQNGVKLTEISTGVSYFNGGNVGIGTDSPAGKLDIRSDSTWSNSAIVARATTNANPVLAFYRPTGSAATSYPWWLEANGSTFQIKTGSAANIGSESVSTKVTINNSGNVGIGTTSPSGRLHVVGSALIEGSSTELKVKGSGSYDPANIVMGNAAHDSFSIDTRNDPGDNKTTLSFDSYLTTGTSTITLGDNYINLGTDGSTQLAITAGDETNYADIDFANVEDLTITGDSSFSTFTVNAFDAVNFSNIENNFNVGSGDLSIATGDGSMSLGTTTADSDTLTVGYTTTRFIGTGNVGINDTSPDAKLTVFRSEASYAINLSDTEARAGLSVKSSSSFDSKLTISSGASSRQYIQAVNNAATTGRDIVLNPYGGNVGIGTTSSGAKLTVVDDILLTGSSPSLTLTDATSSFILKTNTAGEGVVQTSGTSKPIRFFRNNGVHESMRIDGYGKVGIGITNPTSTLAVAGEIDVIGGDGYRIEGKPWAQFNNDILTLGDFDGEGYATRIMDGNSNEAIRITNSGNVGIGMTSPAAKLDVDGSFKLSDFTSTSVATTGSLSPNQNYQAPTQDTLADLTVDPSGNVVRGMQEGTWTFTKAQLDGTLGMTLISAPGVNKAIIVYESSWMIKYNATGAISANQRYEIRQASNTGIGVVTVLPGAKINEILSNGQTMPGGGASAYGFYSRDVPADTGGRTFKTNTATTLHKNVSNQLPTGVQSVSIKLRYRIYDATTF